MVLGELKQTQFFIVEGSEAFPKIKTDRGYFDIRFGIHHNAPDLKWSVHTLDEKTVIGILRALKLWSDPEILIKVAKAKSSIYYVPPADE